MRLACALVALAAVVVRAEKDCRALTRRTLIPCGLERSPQLRVELAGLRETEGRREAARPFLPSNPAIAASVASRVGPSDQDLNWYLSLNQELEIAGQSWLRTAAADEEVRAQRARVGVARAEVAVGLWELWFEALALDERLGVARKLEAATAQVATTAREMANRGLVPELDAVVADAALVSASQRRLEVERQRALAAAQLSSAWGAEDAVAPEGQLEPLPVPDAATERPEVVGLGAARAAVTRRLELARRARVPNPTLSLFVQNDGFHERVLGVGLGLPIPLPQPLGRTRSGEVTEAEAAAERLGAELARLERSLRLEQATARAEHRRSLEASALFTAARLEATTRALDALAAQLSAGRITVREALLAQEPLFALLSAHVEARLALCVATVRLRRALGATLEDVP